MDNTPRIIRPLSRHDVVEHIFLEIYENGLRDYVQARVNEHAVEGSVTADHFMAAAMIRDRARNYDKHDILKSDLEKVAHVPLSDVSDSLNVVLRRFGQGVRQRPRP